ncbi:hypothetical protein PBY51_018312 [Eleginops maclovinus]|uniref:Uncharacterized protein n=1 Tax=Eleginops maclovinus TaxID=56733 RepID=A0AAN8AXC3_ELEMC|nr:hypothetical protein PBY51_018312 [Eleginops maclovinus]
MLSADPDPLSANPQSSEARSPDPVGGGPRRRGRKPGAESLLDPEWKSIPFSFHDDFNKCVADMFPDSAIARKYSTGKTKATQLIKGAIAAELEDDLAKTCRSQPFSLMCDESNNRKTDKEFVILTRLYDEATLQVATRFLEMPICNVGNAENLYEKLSEAFRKRGIPLDNLIAFNSDNASVMKGRHNSVISRLKTSQPHIQDLGCICHLVQLATGCGIRAAQVPLEDILVGIYTHFDKSAKRCEVYKEFVDFTDSDHLKLLRYCSTRWLSLLTCIQRVLNQWDALQAYFNSHEEVERSVKVHDLASHLRDPIVKTYFLFLSAALKPLSEFNIAFQSEGVQIHRLEEEMCRLLKRILGYLIPVRAIVGVPLREVENGDGHQLADEDLFIGADTKAFMRSAELPVSAEKKIFKTARSFYEAVVKKMFTSFPLDHPLLRDLKVLDPAARLDITPGTEVAVLLFYVIRTGRAAPVRVILPPSAGFTLPLIQQKVNEAAYSGGGGGDVTSEGKPSLMMSLWVSDRQVDSCLLQSLWRHLVLQG